MTAKPESERNEFGPARQYFERALALKRNALGPEHVDVGIAWYNLGTMLSSSGEHRSAATVIARAQAIFEATVGEAHPLATYAVSSQCQVEHGLGHLGRAVELCGLALARFESSPPAPVLESRTRFSMAEALWSMGRQSEARAMARHAAELVRSEDPAKAASIAYWLETRARKADASP